MTVLANCQVRMLVCRHQSSVSLVQWPQRQALPLGWSTPFCAVDHRATPQPVYSPVLKSDPSRESPAIPNRQLTKVFDLLGPSSRH